MSYYPLVEKIIQEIIDNLYPQINNQFLKVSDMRKNPYEAGILENAFNIFDELKAEIKSLKFYEEKLVFPGIKRYFGNKNGILPQNMRISELHELLRKKEDCIKDKIVELEIELEESSDSAKNALTDLTELFKEKYFGKKDALYKTIAGLQKERIINRGDDILLPDVFSS